MVPDFTLRLDALVRAMTNIVIPSIPPANKNAAEQAHLVVAHLRVLSDQVDSAYQFYLADLRDCAQLVENLLEENHESDAASKARAALAAAAPLRKLTLLSQKDLSVLVDRLKSAADGLVKSAAEGDASRAVARLVMEHAEREILRERVWVRSAGIDVDAARLPPLRELL